MPNVIKIEHNIISGPPYPSYYLHAYIHKQNKITIKIIIKKKDPKTPKNKIILAKIKTYSGS